MSHSTPSKGVLISIVCFCWNVCFMNPLSTCCGTMVPTTAVAYHGSVAVHHSATHKLPFPIQHGVPQFAMALCTCSDVVCVALRLIALQQSRSWLCMYCTMLRHNRTMVNHMMTYILWGYNDAHIVLCHCRSMAGPATLMFVLHCATADPWQALPH